MEEYIFAVSVISYSEENGPVLEKTTWNEASDRGKKTFNLQVNFLQRMVLISGLNEDRGPFHALRGPVELKATSDGHFIAFVIVKVSPEGDRRQTEEDYPERALICLHMRREGKDVVKKFTGAVEEKIKRILSDGIISYPFTKTYCEELSRDLNRLLKLRKSAEELGGSLFQVGIINQLPQKYQTIAKQLFLNPEGVLVEELSQLENLDNLLEELCDMGLARIVERKVIAL